MESLSVLFAVVQGFFFFFNKKSQNLRVTAIGNISDTSKCIRHSGFVQ